MTIIEINAELKTAREFQAIFAKQEKDLLQQLAEATADADQSHIVAVSSLGYEVSTPAKVDEVKAVRKAECKAKKDAADAMLLKQTEPASIGE